MVLGEVEQHRRLRGKRLRVLELERQDASHTTTASDAERAGQRGERGADVPADHGLDPRGPCTWPIHSTVVVLPLEPVTAMNSLAEQPPPDLELADDPQARRPRRGHGRRLMRHAGALDDRRRAATSSTPSVGACTGTPAAASSARVSSLTGGGIARHHLAAARPQRQRGGHARAGEPDHEERPGWQWWTRDHDRAFKRARWRQGCQAPQAALLNCGIEGGRDRVGFSPRAVVCAGRWRVSVLWRGFLATAAAHRVGGEKPTRARVHFAPTIPPPPARGKKRTPEVRKSPERRPARRLGRNAHAAPRNPSMREVRPRRETPDGEAFARGEIPRADAW